MEPEAAMHSFDPNGRYSRQELFPPFGTAGQEKIRQSRLLLVGCGALGTGILEMLGRAGAGFIRVVDRDYVEISNLQRQTLFTEADAEARVPKAVAAAQQVAACNSEVTCEPVVADFNPGNAEILATGMDAILDGTDNFETRFLINEVAVKLGIPFFYAGCVGSSGSAMAILPGRTPCLRCLLAETPARGDTPTCDTQGILAPAARVASSLEVTLLFRLLALGPDALEPAMIQFDLWEGDWLRMDLSAARRPDCPVCAKGEYEALSGDGQSTAVSLCGRNMVQISFPRRGEAPPDLDFPTLAARLAPLGSVRWNAHTLSLSIPPHELVVFPDGRCLVKGTGDPAEARALYARYIGT